jgi:hypothetical protein
MAMRKQRVLVLPDIHVRQERDGIPPGHDVPTLRAVLKFAEAHDGWDAIIQLGDIIDLPYFSRYDKNQTRVQDAVKYYEEDCQEAQYWMARFRDTLRRGGKAHLIEGNHDYRALHYTRRYPHLAKLISVERDLAKEGKWNWVPYWSGAVSRKDKTLAPVVQIGKATYGHGYYHNEWHAKKHGNVYLGTNFFYGHLHDIMSYSPRIWRSSHTSAAESCGCLCRFDQPYDTANPATNWTQAFYEFYFRSDGTFNYFGTRIFNNRFTGTDGEQYG